MVISFAVCSGIITAAFIILVIFAVRTAIQLRMTAMSLERLSEKLNQEMDKVQQVSSLVSGVTGVLEGFMRGSAGILANHITRILGRLQDHKN